MARSRGKKRGPKSAKKPAPLALSVAELAAVLQKTPAGAGITVAMIQADVELVPALLVGGKVDLVKYMAWLNKRHGYGEKGGAQ